LEEDQKKKKTHTKIRKKRREGKRFGGEKMGRPKRLKIFVHRVQGYPLRETQGSQLSGSGERGGVPRRRGRNSEGGVRNVGGKRNKRTLSTLSHQRKGGRKGNPPKKKLLEVNKRKEEKEREL